eukprot:3642057-Prymnesium_polylepis.1
MMVWETRGAGAPNVVVQKWMHAFNNGLVFLHSKRCMIVSVALPHSLQGMLGPTVSGDGAGSIRELSGHCIARADRRGWVGAMGDH